MVQAEKEADGLYPAVQMVQAGTPLILMDLHSRAWDEASGGEPVGRPVQMAPPSVEPTIDSLPKESLHSQKMSHIARAAAIFDHHCERLLETALEKRTSADVHDVGALAFFHKAINQVMHKARADATGPTTEGSRFKGAPLHEAIRWASDEDGQEKGEDRRIALGEHLAACP